MCDTCATASHHAGTGMNCGHYCPALTAQVRRNSGVRARNTLTGESGTAGRNA